MMYNVAQLISRGFLLLVVVALATARPQHFGESNQELGREEVAGLLDDPAAMTDLRMDFERMLDERRAAALARVFDPEMDAPSKRQTNRLKCYFNPVIGEQDASNVLANSGLTDLQLELLAQRLAEYNNQVPSGWERMVRAPESKRQSRFRQCYFNPVSCFKK